MIIGHIGGGAVGGYEIEKSLRFRAASSAFLSRTPGAAGNQQKHTFSGWLKYSTGTADRNIISFGNSTTYQIWFGGGGAYLYCGTQVLGSSNPWVVGVNAMFRDPSSHFHVVIAIDTTQATAADRVKFFVNGVQIASYQTATYPSLNYNTGANSTTPHSIGRREDGVNYLDGYLSEINFIDGQALTPSSFGVFNADGVWVPKKYTGTYGTNGFYLPFNDGTNLTELCRDRSGNGNHWTANNISLTAGVNYDWMDDTPTNNYATLNPLSVELAQGVIGNANLSMTGAAAANRWARSSVSFSGGKFYWETTLVSGVGAVQGAYGGTFFNYRSNDGVIEINGASVGAYATWTTNDILGVAFDRGLNTVSFYKNGALIYTGVGLSSGELQPLFYTSGTSVIAVNFGQRPFAYTPPPGFKALCTKNRPSVTITDPSQHHTVITVTKSGDTNFTLPWNATDFDTLFWIKRRDASGDWYQIDGLRGYDKILKSNSTAAETTDANVIGVSGAACTLRSTLPDGTYVIYAWKAGLASARQTNTDGSITSTVSANVTAGFSIVTYTGTGVAGTIGHGLDNAPKMIIVKSRGNAKHWPVYHSAYSAAYGGYLNLTSAFNNLAGLWNNTNPTSSVFSVGGNPSGSWDDVNTVSAHVAYCHAEIPGYSKFGSYTGNGSADGPFVWGDVSVMDVLVKSATEVAHWYLLDSARDAANPVKAQVQPNLPNAEGIGVDIYDFCASGYKLRTNSAGSFNGNGQTYIYAAYAKHPFGAENVSPATAR